MGKIKIHEIAKKLGLTSKEVVEMAQKLNIDVKSHMSGVEEEDAKRIEKSFLKNFFGAICSKKGYKKMLKYYKETNSIFYKFISAQIIDAIVVGIITSVAMSIMNVKYAVLLGFIIGLFNLIPYLGAIIAIVLAVIITIFTGGITQAIWMLVIVTILQQIDANIINPKIIGNALEISPILIIFSVTVVGAYFGIMGMFLAVPIVTVIKLIIEDFIRYREEELEE